MKTRVIHTAYWSDSKINELDGDTRYVYLYCLTNDRINICGSFELPVHKIAYETGKSKETVSAALAELEAAGRIRYKDDWIHIPRLAKYSAYTGSSNDEARRKEEAKVPDWFKQYLLTPATPSPDTSVPSSATPPRQVLEIRNKKLVNNINTQDKELIGEYEGKEEIAEMRGTWKEHAGTTLRNKEAENLRDYRWLSRELGTELPGYLAACRMIRADRYAKRTFQARLNNYVGLRENLDQVEAYMLAHVDAGKGTFKKARDISKI